MSPHGNRYNTDLLLLLSGHRGILFAGNGADLRILVQVVMLVVLLMVMKSLPLVMVLVKFGFRKKRG